MNKINEFLIQFTGECLGTLSIVCYDWLVIAGLIGLILYIFGWKKGKDIGFIMPAIYIIIQILVKVICHA